MYNTYPTLFQHSTSLKLEGRVDPNGIMYGTYITPTQSRLRAGFKVSFVGLVSQKSLGKKRQRIEVPLYLYLQSIEFKTVLHNWNKQKSILLLEKMNGTYICPFLYLFIECLPVHGLWPSCKRLIATYPKASCCERHGSLSPDPIPAHTQRGRIADAVHSQSSHGL